MKAVVSDSWSVLRGGVAFVLTQCGVDVRGMGSSVDDAASLAERTQPDLVVLGGMADMEIADAIRRIRASAPESGIIALVDGMERRHAIDALEAGATAVLTRSATEDELRDAVVRVARGERFVSPGMLAAAFGPPTKSVRRDDLTEREREVLSHLVVGHSNRQIAEALFIGEATVKTHLHHVYDKLGVTNRVQAVNAALELRLVD